MVDKKTTGYGVLNLATLVSKASFRAFALAVSLDEDGSQVSPRSLAPLSLPCGCETCLSPIGGKHQRRVSEMAFSAMHEL